MTIPTNPNIVYKSPKNRDYRVAGIEKMPDTDNNNKQVKERLYWNGKGKVHNFKLF
jgi:hypothetical protein